jgi:hypothetical protein
LAVGRPPQSAVSCTGPKHLSTGTNANGAADEVATLVCLKVPQCPSQNTQNAVPPCDAGLLLAGKWMVVGIWCWPFLTRSVKVLLDFVPTLLEKKSNPVPVLEVQLAYHGT